MSLNTNTDIWVAGAFAAFTVDLLVYPLDTVKTRIQSPNYQTLYRKPLSAGRNTSLLSTLRHHHQTFNPTLFRGLYQGISTVIFVTIPSSGAFFTTYEALKSSLSDSIPPNSTLYLPQPAIHALSSAAAELVSCAILTPAEVLKQNAQVFNPIKDGPGHKRSRGASPTMEVLRQFRAQPTRLFRGYTALAARNLPFTGLQFPIFEQLKVYFLDRRKRRKSRQRGAPAEVDGIFERARITALSAALAGTAAAWVTTPIDVVKTRIMLGAGDEARRGDGRPHHAGAETEVGSRSAATASSTRQGVVEVTRQIFRKEGIRGMFRGALVRSLWTALGSGLYLGCYEGGRHYLEERRRRHDLQEGGDVLMEKRRDGKAVKVGIGPSRSQGDRVRTSGWQD